MNIYIYICYYTIYYIYIYMFIGQTGCWTSEWPSFLGLFGHASSRSRKPPSPQRLPLPFEALDASIRGRPRSKGKGLDTGQEGRGLGCLQDLLGPNQKRQGHVSPFLVRPRPESEKRGARAGKRASEKDHKANRRAKNSEASCVDLLCDECQVNR